MRICHILAFWSHHPHRKRGLAAAALILALLLPACTTPTHPTNQPADPPLANLQTSKLANLHQAAYNYARYHALASDDLLGLKRLAEVCAALEEAGVDDESCREATERVIRNSLLVLSPVEVFAIRNLHEALEARTDDRRIVAELLGVPVEDVELGPNLVENGGFEEGEEQPTSWLWIQWIIRGDAAYGDAGFKGGLDALGANGSDRQMRIQGFWKHELPGKEPPRAGYWTVEELPLENRSLYVLSFFYRTKSSKKARDSVWVGENDQVLFAHDHFLPDTEGSWRKFVVLGWNRLDDGQVGSVRVLLRSWETGQVEFDDVALREVFLAEGLQTEEFATRFELR